MVSKASKEPMRPRFWLNYSHPRLADKPTFYRQIRGKLWGLSNSLSKFKTAKREVSGLLEKECEWLRNKFKHKIRYTKQACMYFFDQAELIKLNCLTLANELNRYIDVVINPPPILVSVCQDQKVVPLKQPVYRQSSFLFL